MEQLGLVLRAVCLGVCICGIGVAAILAVVLGLVGGGLVTTIKDILGIGQPDEDELIDEAVSSIHDKQAALRQKRSRIVGDGGIPDFDAAVARHASDSGTSSADDFSAQSADRPSGLRRKGSGQRFDNLGGGSIRGNSKRNDDYEIYDDSDFFGD